MELINDEQRARLKARVAVSDICEYHKVDLQKGIEGDSLFDILKDKINEARKEYVSKVNPDLEKRCNFFNLALVDIMLKQRGGKYQSRIW